MAEYIRRTAVFEQFDNADADVCETDDFGGVDYGFGMKNIKELINAIPAADVVEVVRCKDCNQSVVIGNVLHCTYWTKDTDENGYCHEGG